MVEAKQHRGSAVDGGNSQPVVAVVIPCYRVRNHVLRVIAAMGSEVDVIYCVDDACPEGSGQYISENCNDPRVTVLFHDVNKGVGGAVVTGYRAAIAAGAQVTVKVDGDGQMDPGLIPRFVRPILYGEADYTKGNRFYNLSDAKKMPTLRLIGNAGLSFLTKMSSGYWNVFDPTNGYTAIHTSVLNNLRLNRIAERYFFESDIMYHLYLIRAAVVDIPMTSVYADEVSNLHIRSIILPFLYKNIRNFVKRIFYCYFLRDFNAASLQIVTGLPLVLFGVIFGSLQWIDSILSGIPATAGSVMIAAFPIITGTQFLLAAVAHDVATVPRVAIHPNIIQDGD